SRRRRVRDAGDHQREHERTDGHDRRAGLGPRTGARMSQIAGSTITGSASGRGVHVFDLDAIPWEPPAPRAGSPLGSAGGGRGGGGGGGRERRRKTTRGPPPPPSRRCASRRTSSPPATGTPTVSSSWYWPEARWMEGGSWRSAGWRTTTPEPSTARRRRG